MQCPRCQIENYAGHSYCDNCRTELKTGVTLAHNSTEQETKPQPQRSTWLRYGWRMLRLMLSAFLLFSVIVVGRAINWDGLMRDIANTKPGIESEAQRTGKPTRAPDESGTRKTRAEKSKSKSPARNSDPTSTVPAQK